MKVDASIVKEQLSKVQIQYHRFPNTYAVVAIAHDEKGFYLGTGVGACVDPAEFNEEIGKEVAKENALKAAEDKLWEIEGILLRERLNNTKVTNLADAIEFSRKAKAFIYCDPTDSSKIMDIMFTPKSFAEFIDLMHLNSTTL